MATVIEARRITLPFPPSANTAYPSNANGRRHLSKRGKAFKEEAAYIVRQALAGVEIIEGTQVYFDMALWFDSNRRADIDSYIKLPKDVICEVLGIDDNFRIVPRLIVEARGIDKANPRCELMLTFYR